MSQIGGCPILLQTWVFGQIVSSSPIPGRMSLDKITIATGRSFPLTQKGVFEGDSTGSLHHQPT